MDLDSSSSMKGFLNPPGKFLISGMMNRWTAEEKTCFVAPLHFGVIHSTIRKGFKTDKNSMVFFSNAYMHIFGVIHSTVRKGVKTETVLTPPPIHMVLPKRP